MNNTYQILKPAKLATGRRLLLSSLCFCAVLQSSFGQNHVPPPKPVVRPLIGQRYGNDNDGDRIDDNLLVRAQQAADAENAALTPAEKSQIQAKLSEAVAVELVFKEPVTQQQIDRFNALGGEITYMYKAVSYGWNGRIPLNRINAVPAAMGGSLVLLNGAHAGQTFMDVATRTGRARPVWASGFAGSATGFSGNTNITIAFADTGTDDTHADLIGRGVYWHDYTASNYVTPTDYYNHGTFVSAVALGTGVASGSGAAPLYLVQNGDITGVTSGQGPDKFPMNLPTNAVTVTITARWNGGGSTSLFLSGKGKGIGGAFGWTTVGSGTTGTSPLTLVKTLAADANRATNNYSPVLIQNSSSNVLDYVVIVQVSNAPATDDGFAKLRGIAPGCNWAMAKVLNDAGHSDTFSTDLSAAIDDLVASRAVLKIKVLNLSLGLSSGNDESLRLKVNTAVSNGIVVVASAGNSGAASTDPARASMVLTLAAMNDVNQLTEYSSTGFGSPDTAAGEDFKPDLMSPGGSRLGYQTWVVSADSSWGDGTSFTDQRANDYRGKWGTSLASPFAAGCAALVIEAMEKSGVVWDFNSSRHSSFVKMVLCATASESNANREGGLNNPTLQRASSITNGTDILPPGKDFYEGYGVINPDAAVEAVSLSYSNGTLATASLGPTVTDRRVWARKVSLLAGRNFSVTLTSPAGGDFDLYLYSATPSVSGTPVLLVASTQPGNGVAELLNYTPASDTTALLVVKRVAGSGTFNLLGNLAPEVDFAADITTGFTPLTVSFTNLTTGSAINYGWTFGDGHVSTNQNPSNIYSTSGTYSVTLTASGPGGANTLTRTNYIVVTDPPPTVAFFANPLSGPTPLTVSFTNLSAGATSYVWDFGDSQFSSDANPTIAYTNPGLYSITLTATGPSGDNSLTRTNYILVTTPPLPPLADFIAVPTNGFVPLQVSFSNLTAGATNYAWDFGDGQISMDTQPTHTFSGTGTSRITLTAIGAGGTNTLSRAAYITAASTPVLSVVSGTVTDFAFSFDTLAGKIYFIEYKDLLDDPAWQPLQSFLGTGSPALVTNSIDNIPQRFFRLRVE